MKYKYFLIVLALFFGIGLTNLKASHVAGADITYECIGNDQYVITLNVFRDCFGTTLGTTESVDFSSTCGGNFNVTLPEISILEVSQLCPTALPSSDCGTGGFPGMEQHVYQDTVTISPACDTWTMSWSLCCRNAQIDNLDTPDSYDLYVESTLNSQSALCNSSPYFTAQPIPYTCVNQQVTYNFGVVENDGDSLAFTLVDALDAAGVTIPYNPPYTAGSPTPFGAAQNALQLDAATGLLTFTPNLTGVYVVVIQVEEFDDSGVLVGTVMRDIQIVVENCTNSVPNPNSGQIIGLTGTATQIDDYTIELCDGNSFSFDIAISDTNAIDTVSLASNVSQVFPGATFTSNPGNPATATISWTAVGGNSFFNSFVVYANDGACPIPGIQTYVYTVIINQSTVASEDAFVVCGQQPANISVQGGDNFVWTALPGGDPIDIGVNFGCDTCDVTWALPDSTTLYEVVSDLSTIGCTNKDTVTVNVVADFGYNMVQSDTNVCLYGDVDFTVTPDTAGTFTYEWFPAPFFGPGDTTNTVEGIISYPDTSDVVFTVESDWGCVKTDTFRVIASQNVQPVMSIVADTTVCLGDSVQLLAVNAVSYDCEYVLEMFDTFGDGWNGASFQVNINGAPDTSLTFTTGTSETATFSVNTGDSIEVVFTSGGFPTEESYILYDGEGNIILQDGPSPANGSVYNDLINCGINGSALVYSWTPNSTLSQDSITDPWATPPTDETYTIVALDTIGGCSDTTSITIHIVPSFTSTLSQSDTAICLLDTVNFDVSPDIADTYTYQWSPSSMFDNDTLSNTNAGFSNSGVITPVVSVTNSSGCTKIETFVVTVSQNVAPVLLVSGDTTICIGDSSQIFANVVNQGVGITDDFEGGIDPANWSNVNIGIASPTCGANNGTDALFFDGIGTREAITNPLNVQNGGTIDFCLFMGNDVAFSTTCENADLNEDVELSYSTNGGATWTNIQVMLQSDWDATGTSPDTWQCFSIPVPVAAQTSSTMFMWSQPNASSCTGCDSWSLDDVAITPVGGSYQYAWSPSSGLNDTTIADPWAFPAQTTSTFYVLAYDSIGGCSDVDSVNVYLVDSFSVATSLSDTAICLYEEFEMSVTPPSNTTYSYTWTPADFLNSTSDSLVIADTVSTSGWLTYIVETANPVGCERLDTFRVQVSQGAQPIIALTGDSTLCDGDTTTLFSAIYSNSPLTCSYCIDLNDDFGDGWNGARLQLWLNDTLAQDSLFSEAPWGTGSNGQFCIDIAEGTEIELFFIASASGVTDSEISFHLINGTDTLFSDGENGVVPQIGQSFTGIANCGSVASPSLGYYWTPAATLGTPDSSWTNAFPASPTTTETYTLIVIDSIGACSDTASYNVQVVPSYTTEAVATDTSICLLGDVSFDINVTPVPNTTYTYEWENSSYLALTTGASNSASNIDIPGVISFNYTVSSPEGCEKEGVASVLVSSGIQPDIEAYDDTTCIGTPLALDPTMNGLSLTGDSCELTLDMFDTFGDGWNGADLTVTFGSTSNSYTLVNGTDSSVTFNVGVQDTVCINFTSGTFPNEESYFLSNGGSVLFSDGVDVDGLAPDQGAIWCQVQVCGLSDFTYTYDWSPSGNLSSDDTKYTVASPGSSTTYTLIVVDTVGFCSDTADINVEVVPIPEPQVTSPGIFCENQSPVNLDDFVNLQGGTWSGSGIVDVNDGTFDPTSGSIGNNTVTYTITIGGCAGDTTFNIPINPVPGAPSPNVGGPYCQGIALTGITASGNGGILTWYDYNQTTLIDTGSAPNLGLAGQTDTLFVNETLNGCTGPFASVPYIVIPQPYVGFSASVEQGFIPLDIDFTNESDDSLTYGWDFANGTTSTDQQPTTVVYTETGDYQVVLVGTDSNGCTGSDTLLIDADDISYVPLVFSPNGDGLNDEFRVTGFPEDNFECIIYNRWGVRLDSFTDPINGSWDGGNQTDGTYFVVINYVEWNGQPAQYSGSVTLLRQ